MNITKVISIFLWTNCCWLLADNSSLLEPARKGERLYREANFEEAIPYYKTLLQQAESSQLQTGLSLRLAHCYLLLNEPEKALETLTQMEQSEIGFLFFQKDEASKSDFYSFYICLKSQILMNLNSPLPALSFLNQCSYNSSNNSLINLEKGIHWLKCNDLTQAEMAFKSILHPQFSIDFKPTPSYHIFAQLQLAKIAYIKGDFRKAQHIIKNLNSAHTSHFISAIKYLSGHIFLALDQPDEARSCFKSLLSKKRIRNKDVLSNYLLCCLKSALILKKNNSQDDLESLFKEADPYLDHLTLFNKDENSILLCGKYAIVKAHCCSTEYNQEQLRAALQFSQLHLNEENFQNLCLFQTSLYDLNHYQELCEKILLPSLSPSLEANIYFTLGIKTLEEGREAQDELKIRHAISFLQKSLTLTSSKMIYVNSLKYLAFAFASLPGKTEAQHAWHLLEKLKEQKHYNEGFIEIDTLTVLLAQRLGEKTKLEDTKKELLKRPNEQNLLLLSRISLQCGNYQEADAFLTQLIDNPIYTNSYAEAFFWKAYLSEKKGELENRQKYMQYAYEKGGQSPFAPLAYFSVYSYSDYMQSKRKAIKHLLHLPSLYKDHPLSISAYYLSGLYYLKDHLSEEGLIIKSKNLTQAIESFQNAENSFEVLEEKHKIPTCELPYFTQAYLQAKYERACCNFDIANHSDGGKKEIYDDYAESLYKELIQEFNPPSERIKKYTNALSTSYPSLFAKSLYQLAELYIQTQRVDEAEILLKDSINRYNKCFIKQNTQLMRTWKSLARIALIKGQEQTALEHFSRAENSLTCNSPFNNTERLDLKIAQSQCHKTLHNYDQAMKLLSEVINEDVISPLRIKAMFLRAEIYELEDREELALKQLEAVARKEGEWAEKAKEKLRETYGYSFDNQCHLRKSL